MNQPSTTLEAPLRFLSLNLWNLNEPLASRMQTLDRFLETEAFDVIFFQEVSPVGSSGRLQVAALPSIAHYTSCYAETGSWMGRSEGLAIFTKLPVSLTSSIRLPRRDTDMDRGLLQVRVADGQNSFQLFNTHLAFKENDGDLRLAQIRHVMGHIDSVRRSSPGDRIILCGDFNDIPGSAPLVAIEDASLLVNAFREGALSQHTFSSSNPFVDPKLGADRRIDYIYCSSDCLVARAEVVLDDLEEPASDHYGLFVELRGSQA